MIVQNGPSDRAESPQGGLCETLEEAVGQVPILRLRKVAQVCESVECYLKLEGCNVAGSIKDKNALYLVREAEERGLLQPGGTIIESSSGNFGVALAMVGAARGYRVIIVVDAKTTGTFRRMLRAYGAELVELEPPADGRSMQTARMDRALSLALETDGAWYPCQHFNPDNPQAHERWTAVEIERAFGDSLDALVVGVSTGGQLSGLARYLKPRYPGLVIVGVDVEGSVIFGTPMAPYKMTGVGLSFAPPNLDYPLIDVRYSVPERLAYSVCHRLAQKEGLLLGASTGAIVAAGMNYARRLPSGSRMALLNPDRGERYLDTVYDLDWLAANGFGLVAEADFEEALAALPECCCCSDDE